MFHSHLDSGGLGEEPVVDVSATDQTPATIAAPSVDTAASVPAVIREDTFMSKALLVGGIALLVYLILQAINKSKKADA